MNVHGYEDHAKVANHLLDQVDAGEAKTQFAVTIALAAAQVHATLALAAATAGRRS